MVRNEISRSFGTADFKMNVENEWSLVFGKLVVWLLLILFRSPDYSYLSGATCGHHLQPGADPVVTQLTHNRNSFHPNTRGCSLAMQWTYPPTTP